MGEGLGHLGGWALGFLDLLNFKFLYSYCTSPRSCSRDQTGETGAGGKRIV